MSLINKKGYIKQTSYSIERIYSSYPGKPALVRSAISPPSEKFPGNGNSRSFSISLLTFRLGDFFSVFGVSNSVLSSVLSFVGVKNFLIILETGRIPPVLYEVSSAIMHSKHYLSSSLFSSSHLIKLNSRSFKLHNSIQNDCFFFTCKIPPTIELQKKKNIPNTYIYALLVNSTKSK